MLEREQEMTSRRNALERRRRMMDAQIAALQAEFAADEEEYKRMIMQEETRLKAAQAEREAMAKSRSAEQENR